MTNEQQRGVASTVATIEAAAKTLEARGVDRETFVAVAMGWAAAEAVTRGEGDGLSGFLRRLADRAEAGGLAIAPAAGSA